MRPKALVLDLHGVLVSASVGGHEKFVGQLGLSPKVWGAIKQDFLEREGAWERMERGETSLGEFAAELSRRVAQAQGRCSLDHASTIWGDPHPFSRSVAHSKLLEFVETLRYKILICIATNNIREWRTHWVPLLPDLGLFNVIFDSSEVGSRKPEERFWEHVEDALMCTPPEIVFVDDRVECVTGASVRGWETVLFQNELQAVNDLKYLLKDIGG